MEPRGTLEGPAQELCIFGDMYGRTAECKGLSVCVRRLLAGLLGCV